MLAKHQGTPGEPGETASEEANSKKPAEDSLSHSLFTKNREPVSLSHQRKERGCFFQIFELIPELMLLATTRAGSMHPHDPYRIGAPHARGSIILPLCHRAANSWFQFRF